MLLQQWPIFAWYRWARGSFDGRYHNSSWCQHCIDAAATAPSCIYAQNCVDAVAATAPSSICAPFYCCNILLSFFAAAAVTADPKPTTPTPLPAAPTSLFPRFHFHYRIFHTCCLLCDCFHRHAFFAIAASNCYLNILPLRQLPPLMLPLRSLPVPPILHFPPSHSTTTTATDSPHFYRVRHFYKLSPPLKSTAASTAAVTASITLPTFLPHRCHLLHSIFCLIHYHVELSFVVDFAAALHSSRWFCSSAHCF